MNGDSVIAGMTRKSVTGMADRSPTPLEEGFVSQSSLQTGPCELLSNFVDSIPDPLQLPVPPEMKLGLHTQTVKLPQPCLPENIYRGTWHAQPSARGGDGVQTNRV